MNVEWVFMQDLFSHNPVIDRECDVRITVPVVRVEALRKELDAIHTEFVASALAEEVEAAVKKLERLLLSLPG